MIKLIMIAGAGGFLGTISRFLASRYVQQVIPSTFPFGTFIVNVIGCFLIGLFFGLSQKGNLLSAEWRLFLTVGFCGGLTTFSSFSVENIALLKDGNFLYFALYTGFSVFLGLMATYLGNIFILKLI